MWFALRNPGDSAARVLQTAATNVILAGLAVITGALAARLLGPEGRGELAAIQLWPVLLVRIATLGLRDSLVFFTARNRDEAGSYLVSAIALSLLACIPVAFVGYLLMPLVLAAQPVDVVRTAQSYLVLFIPLIIVATLPIHPLRGQHDFLLWNSLWVLHHLAWLAVLLIAWISNRGDARFVAFSALVAYGLLGVISLGVARRRLHGAFAIRKHHWKPLLSFGVPNAFTSTAELVNLRLDQLVIIGLLPAASAGLYVAAVAWGIASRPLITAIGSVLFPRVAGAASNPQQIAAFSRGTQLASTLAFALGCVLLAITPWGLPFLFGSDFRAAVPPALVLVVGGCLWGLNGVMEEGIRGLGHPKLAMKAELVGVSVTAAGLILFIGPFGLMGAAIASTTGFTASALLLIRWSARLIGESVWSLIRPGFRSLFHGLRTLFFPSSNQ